MGKIGKFSLYFIISLVAVGFVYQLSSTNGDIKKFPAKGELIDIGGYRLHSQEFGKGNITVVFDSGMGDTSLAWNKIVPEISKVAKVLTYDRAGLGWSDKSPQPRTSTNIVEELRLLLSRLEISGPYILVGHSFGGLNMQLFAKKYPQEVAGLVLVDSAHEDQAEKLSKTMNIHRALLKGGMWAAPIGLPRLYSSSKQPEEAALKSSTKHVYTWLDESASFDESATILKEFEGGLSELPLTVISKKFPSAELEKNSKSKINEIVWAKLQEELAGRSQNTSLVFSKNKQHSIHKWQPDIVIDAIRQMLKGLEE